VPIALALACAWLLAGCGGGGSSTNVTSATGASGPANAQASSAQPPPCRASVLQISRQSAGAGLGSAYLGVTLRNGSGRSCVLRQTLRARLLGPSGSPLLRSGKNDSTIHTVVVGPGRSALLTLGWGNWCRNAGGPFRAQLVLPAGGGRLLTRPWGPPGCTGQRAGSKLFVAGLHLGAGRK
jgi:Protein of unknown function (DUF4232)